MSNIPENLLYSNTHEWLRVEDGIGTIGITDHAQNELTEIVFVELPEVGRQLAVNDACAVVESVKSASDIHAPAAGEVLEVNATLVDAPELANDNPYDDGWFFKIKLACEPSGLLDASQYAAEIGEA